MPTNTNTFPDIDAIIDNASTENTSVKTSGNTSWKNMKILDADNHSYATIGFVINEATKQKIEDMTKLLSLIGFTITDEKASVEVKAVDFSKIKVA